MTRLNLLLLLAVTSLVPTLLLPTLNWVVKRRGHPCNSVLIKTDHLLSTTRRRVNVAITAIYTDITTAPLYPELFIKIG